MTFDRLAVYNTKRAIFLFFFVVGALAACPSIETDSRSLKILQDAPILDREEKVEKVVAPYK
jgi:hypothetical protein